MKEVDSAIGELQKLIAKAEEQLKRREAMKAKVRVDLHRWYNSRQS